MENLYIHIPFCEKKCKYCDFISYINYSNEFHTSYISSCIQELILYKKSNFKTIYIGGGTPSLLSNNNLIYLLDNLNKMINIKKIAEFTIEVNPSSLTLDKIKIFKKYGITRISIGIQSFSNKILKKLGRIHNSNIAKRSLSLLADNFDNISVDLITGIAEQTENIIKKDIKTAISYNIKHLSCYDLIIENNTPLFNEVLTQKYIPVSDDISYDHFILTDKILTENDFYHYEISSYCKNNYNSKHNSSIWNYGTYLGIGAAAVSFNGNKRWKNLIDPKKYIDNIKNNFKFYEFIENCSKRMKTNEKIMLSLRYYKGLDLIWYKNLFPDNFTKTSKYIDILILNNLAFIKENRLSLTVKGMMLSNSIIEKFML